MTITQRCTFNAPGSSPKLVKSRIKQLLNPCRNDCGALLSTVDDDERAFVVERMQPCASPSCRVWASEPTFATCVRSCPWNTSCEPCTELSRRLATLQGARPARPAAPRARAAASQRESLVPAQHERGLEAGQLVAALEAGPPRLPELARAQAEVEEETPKAVVPPLEAAAWADMPALSGVVRGKSAAELEA